LNAKQVLLYSIAAVFFTGTLLLRNVLLHDYYAWFGMLIVVTTLFVVILINFTDFSATKIGFFYSSRKANQDVVFSKYVPRKAVMTARRSKLYGKCSFCDKDTLMPFKCKYCGNDFCTQHRLPENHECRWLKSN